MLVVGLSGGIASGKSTVSCLLQRDGLVVIDCDAIAHATSRRGTWGFTRIIQAFGRDVLDPVTGEIDRARLARRVFNDKALRRRLNAATHLPIGVELVKQILWHWLMCRRLVVVDMPLLFETGLYRWTWPRILVYVAPGTQARRLVARDGLTAEEAVARLNAQMPLDQKLPLAEMVLSNEGSLQQLEHQVTEAIKALRARAGLTTMLVSPIGLVLCTALTLAALAWTRRELVGGATG